MKSWVALMAVALSASACGTTGGPGATSPSPSPVAITPTPVASPSPPALVFKLNGVNSTATGTITLIAHAPTATTPGTVTLELVITGLQPNSSHVSHIHVGSCEQRGSIAYALNQVVADGQGDADTRSTVNITYPPVNGHWYVVVHAGPDMQGSNATYLLCGDLF